MNKQEYQNTITQSQYNIDKGRKDIREMREELNELMDTVIARQRIKWKDKRKKKYLKRILVILSLIGLKIILVTGIFLIF